MKCDQRTKNDKVVDDTSNEETMKSTCRQAKKEDKQIPRSYIMLIVLRIDVNSYRLPYSVLGFKHH